MTKFKGTQGIWEVRYITEGEDVDLNEVHTQACDILEQILDED